MPSVLASLAHVAKSRDPDVNQRRAPRVLVDMVSHVVARGRSQGVRIINISSLGLMCRTDAELFIGERISVWLPIVKEVTAEVRWAEDGRVGVEFMTPIEPRMYDAMLSLIPPRQTAW
ncbi:PilZ domain-containing protein [Sphingobium bisphenolivorans]|uniref:PilZ domain-containing protein n=1 Tax=Sphingobium bisphenolivorans TaxID=1335760 RepID=UPI0003A9FDA4|nr:PilZ domain-containing protein [Sphingobium bisphenolivorans]